MSVQDTSRKLNIFFVMAFCAGLYLAVPQAFGADVDAGKLIQQSPQTTVPKLPQTIPSPGETQPDAPVIVPATQSGPTVFVKELILVDTEKSLSSEEIEQLLGPAKGQHLNYAALVRYRDEVTRYLKAKGWLLARAYLPRQDVTDGIVEIHVILGRVTNDQPHKILPGDKGFKRTNSELLETIARKYVPAGQSLNERQLNRSVLIMNDLAGITARAKLEPGTKSGETRVKYLIDEAPLHNFMAWVDNHGSASTGEIQGTFLYKLTNPSGQGDQFSALLLHSEGSDTRLASYSYPLTPGGLKFSLSFSDMDYSEITDTGKAAGLTGEAQTFVTSLSYPMIRSRTRNVYLSGSFNWQALEDDSNSGVLADKEKVAMTLGVNGDWLDAYHGGSYNSWSAALVGGDLDLSNAPDDLLQDSAGYQTDGHYQKLTYSFSRLQRLPGNFTLYGALRGQHAFQNLDSSEQMSLGGANGVRAYPVSEASGDSAEVLSIEVRYDLPQVCALGALQLKAFYDGGHVRLHHDTHGLTPANLEEQNEYILQGVGLGASLVKENRYMVQATWATKVGEDNPGRDFSGMDADGKSDDQRFWLQAIVWF